MDNNSNYEKVVFTATMNCFTDIMKWVQKKIKESRCPFSDAHKIELALEEAVVNVIRHGYKEKGGPLEISCSLSPKEYIQFQIADSGIPFNPLEFSPKVYSEEELEERIEGGLGVIIIKETMSEANYEYTNGKNVLTLLKKIGARES